MLAIRNVTVVDVVHGSIHRGQTVLITGDRIVAVGPSNAVRTPRGARVLETSGAYLIPGFVDMHVHTLWDASVTETFLPLFVANGVTTVRDMGGTLELLRWYRGSMVDGASHAPRVVAAGAILDGADPVHRDISLPIETTHDAVAAVDAVAAAGADFVKVYTMLSHSAFDAILAAAEERGLPVSGHVPYEVGAVEAANAGMVTIEHLMSEVGGYCNADDPDECEAAVGAFRENGTRHVPTLVAQGQTRAADLCGDFRLRYLAPAVRQYWFDGEMAPGNCSSNPKNSTQFSPGLPAESWLVSRLVEGAVSVLAGTDAGVPFAFPGWSLHDELQLLVEAGLSPAMALRAATWESARALGRDDELGAIRSGYLADLVLLSENPLNDIGNTRRIEAVVLNGRYLDRGRLDAMFAEVADLVRGLMRDLRDNP